MAFRPQCVKIGMSFHKETAYGTAVLDANINKRYDPREPVLLELAQERIDDTDSIKGHEFPVDTTLDQIVAQNITIPFTFPSTLSLLGLLNSFAFGVDAVSGTTPNFTHVYKSIDACVNDQLPSTSWALGFGADTTTFFKAKGLVINELRVVMDSVGFLTVSGNVFSDGTLTAIASYVFPTTLGTLDPIQGSQADLLIGPTGGALVSQKSIFRGFEFVINNNLDVADGRSNIATSGKFLSSLRFGNRQYSLTLRVEGHQGDARWTDYTSENRKDIQITITKDANRLYDIRFKDCRYSSARQSFDGIRDVLELQIKPFYVAADASPIVVTVKNGDAAYLL